MTKYSKIDYRAPSFIGSDMSNKIRYLDYFNTNVSAMSGCRHNGGRRTVGLVAPKNLIDGYEEILKKEFSKSIFV